MRESEHIPVTRNFSCEHAGNSAREDLCAFRDGNRVNIAPDTLPKRMSITWGGITNKPDRGPLQGCRLPSSISDLYKIPKGNPHHKMRSSQSIEKQERKTLLIYISVTPYTKTQFLVNMFILVKADFAVFLRSLYKCENSDHMSMRSEAE